MIFKGNKLKIFILSTTLILFIYQCFFDDFGSYYYAKEDNYYSNIVKYSTSNKSRTMIVGYGVFDVFRSNDWLDIARMNVSIRNCYSAKYDVYDEVTSYSNELEYWLINITTNEILGPLNKNNYLNTSKLKSHKYKLREVPADYIKYYLNTGIDCFPESVVH